MPPAASRGISPHISGNPRDLPQSDTRAIAVTLRYPISNNSDQSLHCPLYPSGWTHVAQHVLCDNSLPSEDEMRCELMFCEATAEVPLPFHVIPIQSQESQMTRVAARAKDEVERLELLTQDRMKRIRMLRAAVAMSLKGTGGTTDKILLDFIDSCETEIQRYNSHKLKQAAAEPESSKTNMLGRSRGLESGGSDHAADAPRSEGGASANSRQVASSEADLVTPLA